jgi:D-3-phosphoglycerate dehydrogenase
VITRSATTIDKNFLNKAGRLKVIGRAGVGTDNIDVEEASRRGIIVMNVPAGNTLAAVELTVAHIMSTLRSLPNASYELKHEHIWNRKKWMGMELSEKTLGIIGFGRIGSRVAKRCMSFGAKVVTYDPYIKKEKATNLGCRIVDTLDELLEVSDIITIHTPKTEETYNIITSKQIDKMKDDVILINCARGGLYNEDDLYDALKNKKIRALGIDVFDNEPVKNHKLFELENVFVTPHIGGITYESQVRVGTQIAQQVIDALKGYDYANAINLPFVKGEIPDYLQPFFGLAERIGSFLVQVVNGSIQRVQLEARGEIAEFIESLRIFSLVGLLKPILGEDVNYVNAPYLIEERGIVVEKEKEKEIKPLYFKNFVRLRVWTDRESLSVGGTVFEENRARIVAIDGFSMEVEPSGIIIVIKNYDKPGVIGQIGTILGESNINIADFRLARKKGGREALALVKIDAPASLSVVDELSQISGIIYIKQIKF